MGTPDIAATCLCRLVDDGHNVIAAVSQPDKPKGRKYVLTPPPVKVAALQRGIPVYQPEKMKDGEFEKLLQKLDPELIAVVAYGKILPKFALDYPCYGCINVHASLLPKYRGAAPMQRAIMDGERETGVTIMYMEEGLDTGDMLTQESFPISQDDDFGTVHDRTAEMGARMLSEAIVKIERGEITRTPQDDAQSNYAQKIEKEDCELNFRRTSAELDCQIRGLSPVPYAYTTLPDGKKLKIAKAYPSSERGECGRVLVCDAKGEGRIVVGCADGSITISALIPEGKGKMSSSDFIRGRKINENDILGAKA